MQVKTGDRTGPDVRARADAIEDLLFHDYYSRTARIRLSEEAPAISATEIVLDSNDVAVLVQCAIRHPSLSMRHVVLTAIWNDPQSFRDIFRFGLHAPEEFPEIRKLVIEELAEGSPVPPKPAEASGATLLPRLPLPAHLRDRNRP